MMTALAAALSLLSGYLLTHALWPGTTPTLSSFFLKLSLGIGFGLGISSAAYFIARMADTNRLVRVDILLLGAICILYVLVRLWSQGNTGANTTISDIAAKVWLQKLLVAVFVTEVVGAIYASAVRIVVHPHGEGWDAFSVWNLHARFLFLGGAHWRDGFNSLIPWSHPDYPLLVPATTARLWSYLGHNDPLVPAILGVIFTSITFILLVSSLAELRGRNAALLAGITLCSTPFFIEQGSAQYADIPLSFFILASIVLLHLGFQSQGQNLWNKAGAWILAGVAAGFAAWTKNEGVLFLSALLLSFVGIALKKQTPEWELCPRARYLLPAAFVGVLPLLAVIGWFKHSVATAGDLFSSPAIMIDKLLTPSRYWAILRWFVKEFFQFGDWWIIPGTVLLVAFYFLCLGKTARRKDPDLLASAAALGVTLAGYFAIYLITPRDLYWHLRFSLNRLFLQLWPATVFLFFLFMARQTPDAQSDSKCRQNREPVKKITSSP